MPVTADEVKARLDHAAFYESQLGRLTGEGVQRMARCPFHEDATPSLSVNVETGLFHCFGCGASGDVIAFVQRREGVPFPEALARLAAVAGVATATAAVLLPSAAQGGPLPGGEELATAFHEALLAAPEPLAWLRDVRLVSDAIIRRYRLGYVADEHRVSIPVRDASGTVVNIRAYRVGDSAQGDKVRSWRAGFGKTRLFPIDQLDASDPRPVWLVEGEGDCLAALSAGLRAVTTTGGAGARLDAAMLDALHGHTVRVLYDADDAGRAGALARLAELRGAGIAAEARDLDAARAHGDAEHFDLTDWLRAHGTADAEARLAALPALEPDATAAATPDSAQGLAEGADLWMRDRLIAAHGHGLRFVEGWGWLSWSGVRWRRDAQAEAQRAAEATARALFDEAMALPDEDARRRALVRATQWQRHHRLVSLVECSEVDARARATPTDFDALPRVLNTPTGLVDLATATVRPSDPAAFATRCTAAPFDPEAAAPRWEAFLARVLPDAELRAYVQRAVGYSLLGQPVEHALFQCWGSGANGKSVFVNTLARVLGDYARAVNIEMFLQQRHPNPNNHDLAALPGLRFVYASESADGRALHESRVKLLAGGDAVTARHLYGHPFTFTPVCVVWLSSNYKPTVRGTDEGIWRRLRLIPFTVTIPEGERDPHLAEALDAEAAGILAWAVRGARRYLAEGLGTCRAVADATAEYREASDTLAAFLDEACERDPDAWCATAALFTAFKAWCDANGERARSKIALGRDLTDRGFTQETRNRARGWRGLRPRTESALRVPSPVADEVPGVRNVFAEPVPFG